jgi:D-alanyl-D-alanine carboxypeptidase
MRTLIYIIFYSFFICLTGASGVAPQYAAIVIDAQSGAVMEQENADEILHPASLTKMLTLYMMFEGLKTGKIKMATRIPVSTHASRQIPSRLGLRKGEYITIETIIKSLVTKSANDAAAAIAEYLGGTEANFATMMTRKARSLGMQHSIFKNASGVPNPFQITTARDMATLSRCLYLDFPQEYRYFRLQAFHHRGKIHRNHNHLLGKVPGLDGIKTGFVTASGFNLAASAIRKGVDNKPVRLIAVVMGGPNRHWRDRRVVELLETNFQKKGIDQKFTSLLDEQDNDEEDTDVALFLKEEKAREKAARTVHELVAVKGSPASAPVEDRQLSTRNKGARKKKSGMVNKNLWGVQIGSYKSRGEAQTNARKTLAMISSGVVSTPRSGRGGKSSYQARLTKLTRKEAEKICRGKLSKTGSCRILSSE